MSESVFYIQYACFRTAKKRRELTALLCSALLCSALLCSALLSAYCAGKHSVKFFFTAQHLFPFAAKQRRERASYSVGVLQLADPVGPCSFASPPCNGFAEFCLLFSIPHPKIFGSAFRKCPFPATKANHLTS